MCFWNLIAEQWRFHDPIKLGEKILGNQYIIGSLQPSLLPWLHKKIITWRPKQLSYTISESFKILNNSLCSCFLLISPEINENFLPDFFGNMVKNSVPGSRVVFFKCRSCASPIKDLEINLFAVKTNTKKNEEEERKIIKYWCFAWYCFKKLNFSFICLP